MKLVANYDPQSLNQLELINKKIDRLYLTMKMQPEVQRTYSHFQQNYVDIDVDIRAYERRQQMREKNEESIKQAAILASLWQQDMQTHKQKTTLSDFMIKRRKAQYQRLISSMLEAEMAKKITD
ncbi:hypothetical protein [Marinomonas sp. PE14-40]|uniref:hypothetical protein n=1 Tax=Marinomonas sp. PE14-40 TaxID=3060621 RepID=UPI003F66B4BA